MSEEVREIHVERLLGRQVRDADGRVIGRVEELRVEIVAGEPVVTEFHLGPHALLERVGGLALALPFFQHLSKPAALECVRWSDMDLTDPDRPIVRGPRSPLAPRAKCTP